MDAAEVTDMLNSFDNKIASIINDHNGNIERFIGDGVLAYFLDTSSQNSEQLCAKSAVKTIKTMPMINEFLGVDLKIGIGISTGKILFANLARKGTTILGSSVNRASRLQELTKELKTPLLIDSNTYKNIDHYDEDLKGFVPLKNYRIRGLYRSIDIFALMPETIQLDFINEFHQATSLYSKKKYNDAFKIFARLYADSSAEQYPCLMHYLDSCLKNIGSTINLFSNAEEYDSHSSIQCNQADLLEFYISKTLNNLQLIPTNILDLGSGTGSFTKKIYLLYPNASVTGIDNSKSMIEFTTNKFRNHNKITFRYCPIERVDEESIENEFDLIVSNSTMHWVLDQETAYKAIRRVLSDNGIVAIHQGYKGCYQELRDLAFCISEKLSFSHKFKDFNYAAIYHDGESISKVLQTCGFKILRLECVKTLNASSLIDDFIQAGLLPFTSLLNNVEKTIFVKKFQEEARELPEINTNRLYLLAMKDE